MKILIFILCCIINTMAISAERVQANVIIPFGPGGGTDTIFRKLQKYGEQQGIILNPIYRPGANGLLGMQAVYDAAPDGQTFGIITFDTITAFSVKNKIDTDNIITIQKNTFGIVTSKNKSFVKLMDEYKNKNNLKIGYLLLSQKVIMERALKAYGLNNDQIYVPYKSGSEMIQNAVNGDIDMAITSLNVLAPIVKSGKLKLIAIDSNQQLKDFDNVFLLTGLDKSISNINKGSSLVLPPDTDVDKKRFWMNFVRNYLNDTNTKLDSDISYWEPVYKSTKDIEKDLIENLKILNGIQ